MCRIGFGVGAIRLVIGSVALFSQRHSNFGSVLFRQVESPFDPWLARLGNGMQGRMGALGRQLAPDQLAAELEMKRRLPLREEGRAQAKDEAGEEKIDLRHAQAFRVLFL